VKTDKKLLPCWKSVKGIPRLEYYRRYNAARRDKQREWKKDHPRTREMRATEYAKHREKNLASKKQAYRSNPEKYKAIVAEVRAARTEAQKANYNAYQKAYRAVHGRTLNQKKLAKINASVELKLLRALRGRINTSIRRAKKELQFVKKCATTKALIGCSVDQLIAHIEKQFVLGMTWKNHGPKGWHVDHILPCASFDMTDPEQQKRCFHYTNLQPLWWRDNLLKKDKIQPTLQ